MSQGYGPYTVTAGTIQAVGIDPNSTAVFIQNDSPYYLFVSFNPTQPSPSTILNLDWSASIKPFDSQTEYLVGDQLQTPQGAQTFQGKVWLLPVNLRNVALAQTGTVSSSSLVSVRSFLSGEQPPVAYSSSRQTDITSQPRAISIPITPAYCQASNIALAVGARSIMTSGRNIPATLIGGLVVGYLFFLTAMPSGAPVWSAWNINAVIENVGGTVILRQKIYQFIMAGNIGASPVFGFHSFQPSFPLNAPIVVPANADTIWGEFELASSAGSANASIYANIGIGFDVTTQVRVPDIGATNTAFVSSSGVLF